VALTLYNTLSRKKELFEPLDRARVRMYVCGPTVYDYAHIGNARPVIVFDVLFRLLRHLYGPEHVTYVRNITDVDDKINARAAKDYPGLPLNEAIGQVTQKTADQFHADMGALGTLRPTVEPRATEHIGEMRTMIDRLIANGCAYVAEDHVLFHVAAMPDYGRLSGRSLDEMIAGARVEVAPYKRDPMDFVLWKPSKPGEPSWASPGGIETPGRPGWHIECSAMAEAHLGEVFDIHGGGIDLVFPHHENEIAQSRCAHGTQVMANVWMHNGFLQVEGEKMSKSLGNFVTVHELLTGWQGRAWTGSAVRLAMLGTHYRQPIDWTLERLNAARLETNAFGQACDVRQFVHQGNYDALWTHDPVPSPALLEALSDDLNTPNALSLLRSAYRSLRVGDDESRATFVYDVRFLGLFTKEKLVSFRMAPGFTSDESPPFELVETASLMISDLYAHYANNDFEALEDKSKRLEDMGFSVTQLEDGFLRGVFLVKYDGPPSMSVDDLIAARNAARKAKDFTEADRIRGELEAMGIVLKDAKDPKTGELVTTWEAAR